MTERSLCRRWPKCSCIVQGYVNDREPNECGRAQCNCNKPHRLPVWDCPVHGDVAVDAG